MNAKTPGRQDAEKLELRQHYREVRRLIPEAERARRSLLVVEKALALPEAERAVTWFVYLSAGAEVQTRPLIAALLERGRRVAVPRVLDGPGQMHAVPIRSLSDLVVGRYSIEEPAVGEALHIAPDLTVVPGVAFTRDGKRMGQGGGYYDHYLAQHPGTHKLGLCFTEQLADHLPTDEHDIRMDQVISA